VVISETRRKYDAEFREGAVRIIRETGKPIAQVARDLGIHEGTLRRVQLPGDAPGCCHLPVGLQLTRTVDEPGPQPEVVLTRAIVSRLEALREARRPPESKSKPRTPEPGAESTD
jgi:transposase-like protein